MIGIALTISAIIFVGYITLMTIGGILALLEVGNIKAMRADDQPKLTEKEEKAIEANQLASNAGLL